MRDVTPLPFDSLIARWFRDRYGSPTDIQQRAWKAVSDGAHVLITAPTGSGKTLAAFLWALDRLITGDWPIGRLGVLYVSPLKALNNDIRRNLMAPLAELREVFGQHRRPFPAIQVQTRSGDTPQPDRRRMIRRPPEILVTTPESLNLLLSSQGGRSILGRLNTVILDEIHAIMDSRRGTYLMTAVERLTRLSGEFQRIALSATITPLEAAAEMVGGYRLTPGNDQPLYQPRHVTVLASEAAKRYDLAIRRPLIPEGPRDPNDFWGIYAACLGHHIDRNQSTLVFANSRRLCEKLTYLINTASRDRMAYSHHGALSREIRTEVETQLKAGQLKAIVATGSLELGIDIGTLDEVILVQSPWTVSEAVQRVGRAGHGVGRTSRGTFYSTHALDTISAAVIAAAAGRGDIEKIYPLEAPLDVLAQVIVSMTAFEPWHPDDLFDFVRTATPYRQLSRRRFDLVLEMLEGRYRKTRIRELQPRISHDRLDRRVTARKGAVLALYSSGGVIPDRGYYHLRHARSAAIIGELDEEFVWEARVGQEFTLGAQNWRIRQITHSDVLVDGAAPGKTVPPFWRAEAHNRSFHLSEKIGEFLEKADAGLDRPVFARELMTRWRLDEAGAEHLVDELGRQRVHTGCPLPHRHHLVLEDTTPGAGTAAGRQIVWHTLWGGRVNRPLAMALEAAWEERFGSAPQVFATNDALTFLLPQDVPVEGIVDLVRRDSLDAFLHRRLAATGFFGARFRECAGRALLLPRNRFDRRMPLWLTRRRAQHLLAAVADQGDFPIVLETWRTCLQDEFDLTALRRLLGELENGTITWTYARTPYPSPLARNSTWQQTNQDMYADDTPGPGQGGTPAFRTAL